MGFVDIFATSSGAGTPGTNGITPNGAPEVALISTCNLSDNSTSSPDVSWSQVGGAFPWYFKLLPSAAPILTSQVIGGAGAWISLLTLFGSDGQAPGFSGAAVGSITNPGLNQFRNLAGPQTFLGGETVFILLHIFQSATGFPTGPQTFIPSDSAGLGSWSVIAAPSISNGTGQFAQVYLAMATNILPGTTQVRIFQTDGNAAGFNKISGAVSVATHLGPVGSVRLLLSMGVGI